MIAIATLLVVLTVSLLCVRVATVMLVLTGLSLPLARFQARCAFTGCGYTTTESEQLVNHPVRRQIISTMMLLGNAGIVTTVGTLAAGLLADRGEQVHRAAVPTGKLPHRRPSAAGYPLWARLAFLVGGVAALWVVARSKLVERWLNRWTFRLLRRYTSIEIRDYANLMHLSGEYGINELRVDAGDWVADRPLRELRLTSEGVIVLGINRRDGSFDGTPTATMRARAGDTMILYGRVDRLGELDRRRADDRGLQAHAAAVADAEAREAEEQAAAAAS